MRPKQSAAVRMWRHVIKTDGCWLWTGAKNEDGYGRIGRGGRNAGTVTVHRTSWELHKGAIPDDMQVLHRCDVRNCVNPDHLFLGTQAANVLDMYSKGRNNNVGPLGEKAGAAKLTKQQVLEILAAKSSVALAAKYGISYRHLRQIKTGVRWQKALRAG